MNKSAIKGFSIRARRKLIEDIRQKAFALGIKDTKVYEDIEEFEGGFRVKDAKTQIVYTKEFKSHREKLITEINRKGFDQVIEEVAYTWFNRIIAIRYMEINEYLPVKVRILSSESEGKVEPDVLANVYDYIDALDLDRDKVFELKESHKDEELFKYIFIRECNKLGNLMPQVFEKIGDFTELLLPDQLLTSGSVIRDLIELIEEDDFKEEVEIIGWMYQYYISEKKDEVFAALKKNKKITKENIPAATQLFTPKWIVKYMTENSLGRLWQESHPNEELKKKWKYYIEPAKQEVEVQKKLDELKNPNLSPEDIKILDPAMGSGHILVYAFDLLYDIYLSRGYSERDIPKLILEKNLYGLDIDDRAAQMATFAILMKGRSKSRKFFRSHIKLNVCSIQESNDLSKEAIDYFAYIKPGNLGDDILFKNINYLIESFIDAKEYGSILDVNNMDCELIEKRIIELVKIEAFNIFEYGYINELVKRIPNLILQTKIMTRKYDVVVTNPPYMGNMPVKMTSYVVKNYPISKYDLYAVFMEKCLSLAKDNKFVAMITQQAWMFLSSFEKFRPLLLLNSFVNMVHLGSRAFEEIGGEVVQTTSFVIRKNVTKDYRSSFIRLIDYTNHDGKEKYFFKEENKYYSKQENFNFVPGYIFAYWISEKTLELFQSECLLDKSVIKSGIVTGNNNLLLKRWYEISINNIGFEHKEFVDNKNIRWVPMHKGGEYRKYYGNHDYVMNLHDIWEPSKITKAVRRGDTKYYFRQGITWSTLATSLSARLSPPGFVFDTKGSMCFVKDEKNVGYILGLLNSVVTSYFMSILSPTLDFNQGAMGKMPLIIDKQHLNTINELSLLNMQRAKLDWDIFEYSWDFRKHLLLIFKPDSNLISDSFEKWEELSNNRFHKQSINEVELNKIFIKIYGLQDEISPLIEGKKISLSQSDLQRELRGFMSYFVGCVLGRYSLDEEGLIFAGGNFDPSRYSKYKPTEDNILIISEEDYFENDVAHRFTDFLSITFGEENLEENLKYIACALNPKSKSTTRQTIRNYFIKDFYKDHLKIYKKRPIYWMIESGKKNGIKALFYMHRYNKSTIARFRTDYLHEIQISYENDIELTMNSNDGNSKKKVDNLKKKLMEVNEFDKVVAHIANKKIEIDLDDGVEHNYELFQGIEVPQGDGQKPVKRNLLAKRK